MRIIVSNKIPGDALAGNHCHVPFLLPILGSRALALSVFEWKGVCGGGGGKEREMFLAVCGCSLVLDGYCSLIPLLVMSSDYVAGIQMLDLLGYLTCG